MRIYQSDCVCIEKVYFFQNNLFNIKCAYKVHKADIFQRNLRLEKGLVIYKTKPPYLQ